MSVPIGVVAPAVRLEAWMRGMASPQRVSLADYHGKWVVLVFYPRDFTFVCPTELQALASLQREFESEEAVVLAASTDSYHSHKAWFEADLRLHAVTFPVLADTAHRLAKAFGVLLDDGTALRGTFILDPWGLVRHVLVNDLDVGRNIEETLRTLRALKTGELCPVSWTPGEPTLSGEDEAAA